MAKRINLADLDYNSIRSSLLNYLSNQDTIKDLNYQGSAVNFLLDLLAYNTLYYAHFANMISSEAFLDSAQLERSIVSLVKPLGYVIPTKTSSSTKVKLGNVFAASPVDKFQICLTGTTPEGVQYKFWNIDPINILSDSSTDEVNFYEGNYVSLSYGGNGYEFPNQKILINDLNLDINTLRVSVLSSNPKPGTPPNQYILWERYDLYSGFFVANNTEIYTVERTTTGFTISFGSSVGQKLQTGDKLKIEYLTSSGALSNNSSAFRVSNAPTGTVVKSYIPAVGGKDEADLDKVRVNAPLSFSAQQRLVTANDYRGYLSQLGLENVKVWGGETNSPAVYGRVLYSYDDSETNIPQILVKSRLQNRSVITVIPEYIQPTTTKVLYSLSLKYDPNVVTHTDANLTIIKNNIAAEYPQNTFDLTFSKEVVRNIIEEQTGYYLNDDGWYMTLEQAFVPTTSIVTLNFKTEITKGITGSTQAASERTGVYSLDFTYKKDQTTVFIQDKPITFDGSTNPPKIGYLNLNSRSEDGSSTDLDLIVGKVDYATGILTFNEDVSDEVVFIRVRPLSQREYIAKDEVFIQVDTDVEEIKTITQ